jgi:hypothetical protein
LASGLTRPIDVENFPLSACSVQQLASLPLFGERAGKQILHKERTQGFNSHRGEAGEIPTERRAAGQLFPVEQGHESLCPGHQSVVEGFQRAFATNGVTEEDRQKVNHLVVPKAPPRKAHTLTDGGQNTLRSEMLDDQSNFAKP